MPWDSAVGFGKYIQPVQYMVWYTTSVIYIYIRPITDWDGESEKNMVDAYVSLDIQPYGHTNCLLGSYANSNNILINQLTHGRSLVFSEI